MRTSPLHSLSLLSLLSSMSLLSSCAGEILAPIEFGGEPVVAPIANGNGNDDDSDSEPNDDEPGDEQIIGEVGTCEARDPISVACAGDQSSAPTNAPPVPAVAPPECDPAALLASLSSCGPARVIDTDDLDGALASCGAGELCHLRVGAGSFTMSASSLDCVVIEGAGMDDTTIALSTSARRSGLMNATFTSDYEILSADEGTFTSGARLLGGYGGVHISWGTGTDAGVKICGSDVRGGYHGVTLSWQSSGLFIGGSAITGCYEAVGVSWGSSNVDIVGSDLYGSYSAVNVGWGSFDVEVRSSTIESDGAAVDMHIAPDMSTDENGPVTHDVRLIDSCVVRGTVSAEVTN